MPVIVLSARAGEEAALEGISRGAEDYLVKPFSAADLVARANVHIEAARARSARLAEELRSTDWFSRPGEETVSATSFRTIADQLPFIVWLQDARGDVTFVNDEFLRITKLPRDPASLARGAWVRCIHPDDRAAASAAMERAVATQSDYQVELRVKAASDGEDGYRWFHNRALAQRRNGVFQGWLGSAVDIQAQKDVLDRTKRIAQTLQEAFLPAQLPQSAHVRVDAVYHSAEGDAFVGGDWFDVVELADGRLLLLVGDVAGHGINASVIAGRLHHAIVDFALVSEDPAEILAFTNRILRLRHPDVYATALVAFVDRGRTTLTYAGAGHPAPLLATEAGALARELATGGLLLGAIDDLALDVHRVPLPRGDVAVALYTDGLIEFDRDLLGAQTRLREAVGTLLERPFESHPAAAVRDAVLEGARTVDDAALLIVRFFGDGLPSSSARVFARTWRFDMSEPHGAHAARLAVMSEIRRHADSTAGLFESELVLGEVLANVVDHAPGCVDIRLDWHDDSPLLTVRDEGAGMSAQREPATLPDPMSESGRGLYLVGTLASDVSIERIDGGGMCVRARLPVRRSRTAGA
jgi:PAS domain S-box-containing protein